MATKNISITEAAYRRLASMKREHESFSLVINRLTGTHTLLELAGSLSESAAGQAGEKHRPSKKGTSRGATGADQATTRGVQVTNGMSGLNFYY